MILGLLGIAIGSIMPMDYPPTETNVTTVNTVYNEGFPEWNPNAPEPERPHLTKSAGVFAGPSGRETYYNLPMGRIINEMRAMGYDVEHFPYSVRPDGAKCLGPYVMCAANLSTRPKGTIIETSLGEAIVVDTGSFIYSNPDGIDLATDW